MEAEVEAESGSKAFEAFSGALRQYTMLLSVAHGAHFQFRVIGVELENGAFYPGPKQLHMGGFVRYHLPQLRSCLVEAAEHSQLTDDRLDAALRNHKYGLLLSNLRVQFEIWTAEYTSIVGSAFLAYWKSVTAVVGDPSSDRDHQSRFRIYGLPSDFLSAHYEPLKRLRDSHDVAHHSLEAGAAEEVKFALGRAASTSRLVISTYCRYLSGPRLAT